MPFQVGVPGFWPSAVTAGPVASGPKWTAWAGGLVACEESAGTTWHSEQAIGPASEPVAAGFRWAWWAPTTPAGAPAGAMGGAAARLGSVPGSVPVRPAVPWQVVQAIVPSTS